MSRLRRNIYDWLNPGERGGRISEIVNAIIIALILINVIAVSLETVDSLYTPYARLFFLIELFSVLVFTIEYALRFWSAPEKREFVSRSQFLRSFGSVVDLMAIVPFYLWLFWSIDLHALIALRLLRLLKLVRYFKSLTILGDVLRAEFRALTAAMFVLMILVFIAATGIYFFENGVQPDLFGIIPQSMWWATVTLTTLGYGDVVPVTAAGRIFAALITILSIGTVALPAGMLASRFSEELRKRKNALDERLTVLSEDGTLCRSDRAQLETYREKLCLSKDDMQNLIESQQKSIGTCPLCGKTRGFPA